MRIAIDVSSALYFLHKQSRAAGALVAKRETRAMMEREREGDVLL